MNAPLTPVGAVGFIAALPTIVPNIKEAASPTASLHISAQTVLLQKKNGAGCYIRFRASAIKTITSQWVLDCRRRIPELAHRESERRSETDFPESFEEETTGEQRPLLSPGPRWSLRGHMGACLCAPSHQPILHPPPLSVRSVTGPSTWMSHGQSEAEPGSPQSRFPLCHPRFPRVCACAVHWFCQPLCSPSPFERSWTQCENLPIDSCPYIMQNLTWTPPPSLQFLFWQDTGCHFGTKGLLLSFFFDQHEKEEKLMETENRLTASNFSVMPNIVEVDQI